MDSQLAILILIMVAGFILIGYLLMRKEKNSSPDQSLLLLQNQIGEITRTLDTRLGESAKAMQSQFGESIKIIRDVTHQLTQLGETNRQVIGFSEQLQNLQDILKNPKQRGVLGEYYLETVLKNVLPPGSYAMQHHLGRDEDTGRELIPDAVIFVKDKIIPVDSKFSLENYNRILTERDDTEREKLEKAFKQDIKNRIDETSKYVRPKDQTMDFAFMFIPSEGVYYDLLINQVGAVKTNTKDLIEYAFEKHVIIVSPTSFLAYLQTVLQGLRALKIEESAKEIRKNVEELARHIKNYEIYLQKLGTHLGTTVNTYNTAYREFKKVDKDVFKIAGKSAGIEPTAIAGPALEDTE